MVFATSAVKTVDPSFGQLSETTWARGTSLAMATLK